MRTVNAAALSAMRSWRSRPTVVVRSFCGFVRTKLLHDIADTSVRPTAMCAYDGTVYRARVGTDGALAFATVSDVDDIDEWRGTEFANILGGTTCPYPSDVAIIRMGTGQLRIAFVDSSHDVYVIESSDSGGTWGSPTLVHAGAAGTRCALAYTSILVQDGSVLAYAKAFGGAVGAAATAGDGLGGSWACTENGGIAGTLHVATSNIIVLFCDGGVYRAELSVLGVWSTPELCYPGGDQALVADAACHSPAVASDSERLYATWCDSYATTIDGYDTVEIHCSVDGVHWGREMSADWDVTTYRTTPLAWDSVDSSLYFGPEYKIGIGGRYGYGLGLFNLWTSADVLLFTADRGIDYGRLTLRAVDKAGEWRELSNCQWGSDLDLGNVVEVYRGVTVSGTAYRYMDVPYYVVRVSRTEGEGAGVIEITAVDAWGLLALYFPGRPLQYKDRSLVWLAAEICARVGLEIDEDLDSAWDEAPSCFTWNPTVSAAAALRDVLRLGGGVVRIQDDGVLNLTRWPVATASPPSMGDSEIKSMETGLGELGGTATSVRGDGYASRRSSVVTAGRMGLGLSHTRVDWRADSQNMVDHAADVQLGLDTVSAIVDTVCVPLRADIEVLDTVALTGWGYTSAESRLVLSIRERWDARRGIYESNVELGAAFA